MNFTKKLQTRLLVMVVLLSILVSGSVVYGHLVDNTVYLPILTVQEETTVDLPLVFYDPLVLKYNPNKWKVTLDQYDRDMLTHVTTSSCMILEQGPTMPPPSLAPEQIGAITYLMNEHVIASSNTVYRSYLVNENVPGWTDPNTWVFLVSENKVGDTNCESDQRDVLATLGLP